MTGEVTVSCRPCHLQILSSLLTVRHCLPGFIDFSLLNSAPDSSFILTVFFFFILYFCLLVIVVSLVSSEGKYESLSTVSS